MSDKKSPDPEFSLADYYDQVTPHTTLECDGKSIHYSIPNWQTAWRTESLRKKEPETLEWIAGFDSQDVLIDIGANVGMY